MPILSSIQKSFHLLVRKVPIPQIVKDNLPSSIKLQFLKLFSSFDEKGRFKIFESMDFEKMDKDLLRTFIRYYAHILDKISRTRWTESKAVYYGQNKFRLIDAIKTWRKKKFTLNDDILWAEQIIEKYSEWEEEKNPIEQIFMSKEKRADDAILDIIRQRRSIRYFENKSVEMEKIMTILEAGRWAPCSGNRQAWKFVVQKRVRGSYSAKHELEFEDEKKRQGAVLIYVAIDERLYPERYSGAMDAAAAIQNMLLITSHLGLGGCWLYLAELTNQNKLREKLGLEDYYYIYSCILLGYPAEFPNVPCKKQSKELVRFIGFELKESDFSY